MSTAYSYAIRVTGGWWTTRCGSKPQMERHHQAGHNPAGSRVFRTNKPVGSLLRPRKAGAA